MHIAHRVTNTYPSSVQSTRFSGSSTATRWLTSSHWWGDTLWLQACYKVKSIYSLELMKKECFTYFSLIMLYLAYGLKFFPLLGNTSQYLLNSSKNIILSKYSTNVGPKNLTSWICSKGNLNYLCYWKEILYVYIYITYLFGCGKEH